jgi:hypothetical protein
MREDLTDDSFAEIYVREVKIIHGLSKASWPSAEPDPTGRADRRTGLRSRTRTRRPRLGNRSQA